MVAKGKLYFENSYGERREIAECAYEDCHIHINRFLDEHNFKSYYMRIWKETGEDGIDEMKFDVGSHTEFFYWRSV